MSKMIQKELFEAKLNDVITMNQIEINDIRILQDRLWSYIEEERRIRLKEQK